MDTIQADSKKIFTLAVCLLSKWKTINYKLLIEDKTRITWQQKRKLVKLEGRHLG
jgi:hypothetical protein